MKKVLVVLMLALTAACAQLQSAAGGSAPQSFSYPSNGLNGIY